MYEKELELAVTAAKEGARVLSAQGPVRIDSEQGKDIKLSADKESERAIVGVLRAGSDAPILSEECGLLEGRGEQDLRWIVDPLDGTANHLKGLTELTCVSVALWKGNRPVLGVVYRYAAHELYCGVVGEGAWCNGQAIAPSQVTQVGRAVLATGFPVRRDYSAQSLSGFIRQIQCFKKVRMLGAAAIMGTFVAAGRVDAYMEDHIMLWDVAAAAAIATAAGAAVSVQELGEGASVCKIFANRALMEDLDAQGL